MSKCKYCQDEISWKSPFVQGDKPQNLDGSKHDCRKQGSTQPFQSSIVEMVKWETIPDADKTEDMKELLMGLKAFRSLAYEDAKQVHPDSLVNSDRFGMIVNATMSHLINLAKIKAIKGCKK